MRYVALLRGINVGGRNVIRMPELRASFEAAGMEGVRSYIQSGNVLFSSAASASVSTPNGSAGTDVSEEISRLSDRIRETLRSAHGYVQPIALLTEEMLRRVVAEAPPGFGDAPDEYRYDVLFTIPPLLPAEVESSLIVKPEVDTAAAGSVALYFRRLIRLASRSGLSRIVQHPHYAGLTIRNWNTTTRLLAMMEEEPS